MEQSQSMRYRYGIGGRTEGLTQGLGSHHARWLGRRLAGGNNDKAVQLAPTWDAELELFQYIFEPQTDTGPAAPVCCIVAAARLSIDRSERFRVDGIGAQHESC